MTADEFRKILDRFHKALCDQEGWVIERLGNDGDAPDSYLELDRIWCDLNRHCGLMKEAERRMLEPHQ